MRVLKVEIEEETTEPMPSLVVFTSEWAAWLAEVEMAPTDAELSDMATRYETTN